MRSRFFVLASALLLAASTLGCFVPRAEADTLDFRMTLYTPPICDSRHFPFCGPAVIVEFTMASSPVLDAGGYAPIHMITDEVHLSGGDSVIQVLDPLDIYVGYQTNNNVTVVYPDVLFAGPASSPTFSVGGYSVGAFDFGPNGEELAGYLGLMWITEASTSPTPTPEPRSALLLLTGAGASLMVFRRRVA